jgi:hypothetical protein
MVESNVVSDVTPGVPTWRRVQDLADLVEIFDPEVQVCTWQREIDPAIEAYLNELNQTGELQVVEALSSTVQPKLDSLPAGPGRAPLIDDLSMLSEIVCDLMGCSDVGLRLARVGQAMCPGWHIDHTSIRLVSTYQGPGTQWLEEQDVDRTDLHASQMRESAYIQATPGEIVLLKGTLWQGGDAVGAVHRSPEIAPNAALRTLVTLDPLWRP